MKKKKLIEGKKSEVEENETLYRLTAEGEEVFSVQYNPIIEKWKIDSNDPEFHVVWDYRRDQRDEVVVKASAMINNMIQKKIWCWRIDRVRDIAIAVLLLLLICRTAFGYPSDIMIGIFCGLHSCAYFLQGLWFQKKLYFLGAITWLFPTMSWLF